MKIMFFLAILLTGLLFLNCESDPCDEGYTYVDDFCIPDYVVGQNLNYKEGEQFYHIEYGIITYSNYSWIDESANIINELSH